MAEMIVVIFAVLTLAAAALRVYLKLFLIDPDTGFYLLVGTQPWELIFNVLLAVTVAALALLILQKRVDGVDGAFFSCKGAGACAIAAGFFIEVAAIMDGFNLVMAATSGYSFSVLGLLMDAFSVVAGLMFVCHGFSAVAGGARFNRGAAIGVIAIIWATMTMLTTFLSYSVVMAISDNLLHTLSLVSCVLFLLGYFKMSMGITPRKSARLTALFGLLLGFFSIVDGVPGLAAHFLQGVPMDSALVLQTAVLLCLGAMGTIVGCRLVSAPSKRRYPGEGVPFFQSR